MKRNYSQAGLESHIQLVSERGPLLVCFFAQWAEDVHRYLNAYNDSVQTFTAVGVRAQFGLLDLQRDYAKKGENIGAYRTMESSLIGE